MTVTSERSGNDAPYGADAARVGGGALLSCSSHMILAFAPGLGIMAVRAAQASAARVLAVPALVAGAVLVADVALVAEAQ